MRKILPLLLLLVSSSSYAAYNMHFFLPNFPPYTTLKDKKPSGIGIEAVTTMLDSMGVKYTMKVSSNHGKALSELKSGNSDGFFMASKNAQRDKYAVFSNPIMQNRWVWVLKKDSKLAPKSAEFKSKEKTASLLNTNTAKWLDKNGYRMTSKGANNPKALILFLNAERADAIFLAEEVFKQQVGNMSDYKIVVEVAKDFGAYISNDFLAKHPEFMAQL